MRIKTKHLSVYPWHSINIVPQLGCVPLCSDDPPHNREGSFIELVLFGTVIHLLVPFNLPSVSSGLIGPIWSRRRKVWHRPK